MLTTFKKQKSEKKPKIDKMMKRLFSEHIQKQKRMNELQKKYLEMDTKELRPVPLINSKSIEMANMQHRKPIEKRAKIIIAEKEERRKQMLEQK